MRTQGLKFERSPSGLIYLESTEPLEVNSTSLVDSLDYWAEYTPHRNFLAVRAGSSAWRTISYGDFRGLVRRAAQALLNRGMPVKRPIVILSGNGIEHAILAVAALYIGQPYAPIPPSYSCLGANLGRFRHIIRLLAPPLVFAVDGDAICEAVESEIPRGTELLIVENAPSRPATTFAHFLETEVTAEVHLARGRVNGDTVAKILFTSGSTGLPKGVINTHRMLVANQEMIRHAIPSLRTQLPILCDWLPWHHTFGGNHNFGLTLSNGGTLYIDEGPPGTGSMEKSVQNLRETRPTLYFNTPMGFDILVRKLRCDQSFSLAFFSRLELMFYAAASLPQACREELAVISHDLLGRVVPMITGFGCTETAPLALFSNREVTREGMIGLPAPGVSLKLAPSAGKLELCVRGPNVTPGYFGDPACSRLAFDSEGYFHTGDAVCFANASDPLQGLLFDGRTGDDFKLSSGTWVNVEWLRGEALRRCSPLVHEVVLVGENRPYVTALVVPAPGEWDESQYWSELARRLSMLAKENKGSSRFIARFVVIGQPLSAAAGEITDKGTVNQRAVWESRREMVNALYAPAPSLDIIVVMQATLDC